MSFLLLLMWNQHETIFFIHLFSQLKLWSLSFVFNIWFQTVMNVSHVLSNASSMWLLHVLSTRGQTHIINTLNWETGSCFWWWNIRDHQSFTLQLNLVLIHSSRTTTSCLCGLFLSSYYINWLSLLVGLSCTWKTPGGPPEPAPPSSTGLTVRVCGSRTWRQLLAH